MVCLTRTPDDRRLYTLAGVGILHLDRRSRSATAQAGHRSWRIERTGLWRPVVAATGAGDTVVGEFRSAWALGGGPLRWGDRELGLRAASWWHTRYALADGERELATVEGTGLGKRPVSVTVDDLATIEPGLLLFAAFVVWGLVQDMMVAMSSIP